MNFFDEVKALMPWLTPEECSDVLHEVECPIFEAHPEYLELCENEQNAIVLKELRNSRHVRRH